jgi:hypothetical protein
MNNPIKQTRDLIQAISACALELRQFGEKWHDEQILWLMSHQPRLHIFLLDHRISRDNRLAVLQTIKIN